MKQGFWITLSEAEVLKGVFNKVLLQLGDVYHVSGLWIFVYGGGGGGGMYACMMHRCIFFIVLSGPQQTLLPVSELMINIIMIDYL